MGNEKAKMNRWMAVTIVGMTGCLSFGPVYSNSYSVLIDPTFDAEDQTAIVNAIQSWEDISDKQFSFKWSLIQPGQCTGKPSLFDDPLQSGQICIRPTTVAFLVANGGEGKNNSDWIGVTFRNQYDNTSMVYIPISRDMGYDISIMTTIISHELGHALGCGHTTARTANVMFPYLNGQAKLPTCNDLAQAMHVRGQSDIDQSCPQGGSYTLNGDGTY
jgi:hypothetical protein